MLVDNPTLSVAGTVTPNEIFHDRIFPNPASDRLDIDLQNAREFTITITTFAGKKVLEKKSYENHKIIDLSQLAPGIYFCEIKAENRTVHYRLIKK